METILLVVLGALILAAIIYGVSLYRKGPIIPDDDEVYGDDDEQT